MRPCLFAGPASGIRVHLTRNKVFHLNGIAYCKNIRIGSDHVLIYNYASTLSNLNSGHFSQFKLRLDSNRHDNYVSFINLSFFGKHFQTTLFTLTESCNPITGFNGYSMFLQVSFNDTCHFRVKRRHYLIEFLNECNIQGLFQQGSQPFPNL